MPFKPDFVFGPIQGQVTAMSRSNGPLDGSRHAARMFCEALGCLGILGNRAAAKPSRCGATLRASTSALARRCGRAACQGARASAGARRRGGRGRVPEGLSRSTTATNHGDKRFLFAGGLLNEVTETIGHVPLDESEKRPYNQT